MIVTIQKRWEYWNHFIARWAVEKVSGGYGVTGSRLMKIRSAILNDDDFWQDIVIRHNGIRMKPEGLQSSDEETYAHCLGNFWGMIYQNLVEAHLV